MGAITSVAGNSEGNKVDDGENATLRRRFTSMASHIAINASAFAQSFVSEMASPWLSSERRVEQLRKTTEQLDALLQEPSGVNAVTIIKHVRIIKAHYLSTWQAGEIVDEQDRRNIVRVLMQVLARKEEAIYPVAAETLTALLSHDEYTFEHHILGCLPAMGILATRLEHGDRTMVMPSLNLLRAFAHVAAHETPWPLLEDRPTMRPLIRREYFTSLIDQRGLIKPVARLASPEYLDLWDFTIIQSIIAYFVFGNNEFKRYDREIAADAANPIEVSLFALNMMVRNKLLAAYLSHEPSWEYDNRHYSEVVWKIVQAACELAPVQEKPQGNAFHTNWLVTEGHICKLIATMIANKDHPDAWDCFGDEISHLLLVTVHMCSSLISIIRNFGGLEMYDARDFACEFIVNENGAQALARVMNVLHEIRKRHDSGLDPREVLQPGEIFDPGEFPPDDAPLEGWTWESIDDETPTQFLANIHSIDEVCNKLERCRCIWDAAVLDEGFFICDVNWTIYTGKIIVSVLRELIAASNAVQEWRARDGGKMARFVL